MEIKTANPNRKRFGKSGPWLTDKKTIKQCITECQVTENIYKEKTNTSHAMAMIRLINFLADWKKGEREQRLLKCTDIDVE
jgi:hypothetical protein